MIKLATEPVIKPEQPIEQGKGRQGPGMRERPADVDESGIGEEVKERKRIDLSVPQVAGGAVAAVVAAKLASYFGVYGTILGAGVVSVVATCGGSLFQHFFSRTGEQFREAAVPSRTAEAAALSRTAEAAVLSRAAGTPPEAQASPPADRFTQGTVYRARVRNWKRPVVAATLVFGVTMAGITTYELVSGSSFSGGGTTVGDALSGHDRSSSGSGSGTSSDTDPDGDADSRTDSGPGSGGDSPSPAASTTPEPTDGATPSSGAGEPGGGAATRSPDPTPSATAGDGPGDGPSASAGTPDGSATTPGPSASSRSGNAVPDQGGPAAR